MTTHEGPSAAAWQAFVERQGNVPALSGTVTSVVPFGAFVRFDEGVDGLLHVTEWREGEPAVGSTVTVRVLALDPHLRRVSLAQA